MNREIKFRAWDNLTETMVPWLSLKFDKDEHDDEICFYEQDSECSYVGGADYEIMQFTGLHDKNGAEIYEGDLIRKKFKDREIGEFYAVGQVVFGKWFAGFTVPYQYNGYNKLERLSCEMDKDGWIVANRDMEVIGNIHEHPHLLEGS